MKSIIIIIFVLISNGFFNKIHSQNCVVKFELSDISGFGLLHIKIDTTDYILTEIVSDSLEINHHSRDFSKILIDGSLRFPNLEIINIDNSKDTLNLGYIKVLSYSGHYSIPISDFFGDRNSKEYKEYSKLMKSAMREYERNELAFLQSKTCGKFKIHDKFYYCELKNIYKIVIDYSKPIN